MSVPLYHKNEMLDGQQLKLISALCLEAEGKRRGLSNLDRLQEITGCSRCRVAETFTSLLRDGRVEGEIAGGWVVYRVIYRAARPIEVPMWALKVLARSGPSVCRLYYSLRHFVHSVDGVCYPSDRTLAGMMDRTRRTLQRAVKTLQETGLFVVARRSWRQAPRFVWAKFKRIPFGKMVKLWTLNLAGDPDPARTLSPSRAGVCRGVIEALINEVAGLTGRKLALVETEAVPEAVREGVELRAEPASEGLKRHGLWRALRSTGFTEGAARYIAGVFPGSTILNALRKTNDAGPRVRDPKRYLCSLLRRRESVPRP